MRRLWMWVRRILTVTVGAAVLMGSASPPAQAVTDKELRMTRLHAGREVGRECRASQYEFVRALKVQRWVCFSPRASCDRWPWHRSVVVCAGAWLLVATDDGYRAGARDLRCNWAMYYQRRRGERWPQPLRKTRSVKCRRDDWV